MREFVMLLSSDKVSDALLTHTQRPRVDPGRGRSGDLLTVPDRSVIVGVHGDSGALSYRGNDAHGTEPVR